MVLDYKGIYKAIPELSILINGKEEIPDLCFYEKIDFTPEKDILVMEELPLGVVEILSPTQSMSELAIKSHMYFGFITEFSGTTIFRQTANGRRQTANG